MPSGFEIIIKDNPSQLAKEAIDILAMTARDSITRRGRFVMAISGGSTPRRMNRMLAKEPYRSEIEWDKTHIFWVDERCVPENDPASNFGAANKDFLCKIPLPSTQVHPMPGRALPEEGAALYQADLEDFFRPTDNDYPVFDLILLGVGRDGHTASLFPDQKSMETSEKWVAVVKGGDPDVYRLTLTYPVLNKAKLICFLVSREKKAGIVKAILENRLAGLPAQKIQPSEGTLIWLLDKEAASLLEKGGSP